MIHLDVTIMGNPYRLACKEGEEKTLQEAVSYLDGKMVALRDSGKVKGNDRIAVMAALSMAAEFLSVKAPQCIRFWMRPSRRRKICSDRPNSFD
jgi:cell division protein ZapA